MVDVRRTPQGGKDTSGSLPAELAGKPEELHKVIKYNLIILATIN
jgi:hypothetical protein